MIAVAASVLVQITIVLEESFGKTGFHAINGSGPREAIGAPLIVAESISVFRHLFLKESYEVIHVSDAVGPNP